MASAGCAVCELHRWDCDPNPPNNDAVGMVCADDGAVNEKRCVWIGGKLKCACGQCTAHPTNAPRPNPTTTPRGGDAAQWPPAGGDLVDVYTSAFFLVDWKPAVVARAPADPAAGGNAWKVRFADGDEWDVPLTDLRPHA
eukprot:gene4548-66091_t